MNSQMHHLERDEAQIFYLLQLVPGPCLKNNKNSTFAKADRKAQKVVLMPNIIPLLNCPQTGVSCWWMNTTLQNLITLKLCPNSNHFSVIMMCFVIRGYKKWLQGYNVPRQITELLQSQPHAE